MLLHRCRLFQLRLIHRKYPKNGRICSCDWPYCWLAAQATQARNFPFLVVTDLTFTIKLYSTNSGIVGPANRNDCIILRVGNLADAKFLVFNEVSRMKFLGTVVHRLTELLPNHCQHRGNLYHNYIL
jgi:hypothetical protein